MKPNILFIHADQLRLGALGAHGCPWVSTPNLDRLAAEGVSFLESHSANPVCCPARTSWYTGRMSSEHGVVDNAFNLQGNPPDLGQWLSARGYDCAYAGKWHVPERSVGQSFRMLYAGSGMGEHTDAQTARAGEAFLLGAPGEKPFFLNLGFLNPHDICFWTFAQNPGKYHAREFLRDGLPPLPKTYQADQPLGLGPDELRFYIYSYYRMVEMLDREIGRVLRALRASRHARETLVIFSADHGEMLGEHNDFTKGVLHEGALKVPLLVSFPGVIAGGKQDRESLVSGVDITATILDYAGAPAMPNMNVAQSLRPVLEGRGAFPRPWVAAENYLHSLETMVRTGSTKSISGAKGVVLRDLGKDPDETKDFAADPLYAGVMAKHRELRAQYQKALVPLPVPEGGWGNAPKKKRRDEE